MMKKRFDLVTRIICALMCISLLFAVSPTVFASDDDYWSAQKAYNAALESGDEKAILDAVGLIEKAYPNPENVDQYLRLYFPMMKAASIHEKNGVYTSATKYYKKSLDMARVLDESGYYFKDYLNNTEMLWRHNNITPTVYAETADTENIPYYAARGEEKAGCAHGMTDYFDAQYDNAQILYVQFFTEDIEALSWQLKSESDNYTLMIGWNVPNENREDLERIANGEADDYIRHNLEFLSTLDCRVLIRFGAEMNCWNTLPSSREEYESDGGAFAEKFKEAFRHVSLMAKKYAPAAAMVFSPNDVSNWFYDHTDFYPGDEYVDWVGMSAYNNLTAQSEFNISAGNDAYYSVGDYYDNQIVRIQSVVDTYGDRKPIMITEGGIAYKSDNGLQNEQHAIEGLTFFYTYVSRVYPQIKCIMYFNSNYSSNKYSIFGLEESNKTIARLYRALCTENVAMEYSMGRGDACGYVPLDDFSESTENLRLSVYAAYPTNESVTVEYSIGGKRVFKSKEYPYELSIDKSALSLGGQLLSVSVTCRETVTKLYYKLTLDTDGKISVCEAVPESIKDVKKSFWGYEAIAFCMSNGLFEGTSNTKFEPNATMTRAMFVTVLARVAGANLAHPDESSFDDVPLKKWYSPYIEWAVENGIINGVDPRHFAPDDIITREQMCSVLVRYCEKFGISLGELSDDTSDYGEQFKDHSKISPYAVKYVYAAKNAGLITGRNSNKFDPSAGATRAECATVFMRFTVNFLK